MNRSKQISKYLISDFLSAMLAWAIFFLFRKIFLENFQDHSIVRFFSNVNFYLGIVFIPVFWVTLYYASGYYRFIYRKTPSQDFRQTLVTSFIGVIVIFFTLILDDIVKNYHSYYVSASVLFFLQLLFTSVPRIILSQRTVSLVRKGKLLFNTIIIGCGQDAVELYKELRNKKPTDGNNFIGFVRNPSSDIPVPVGFIPEIGLIERLPIILKKCAIDEIIIAISQNEKSDIQEIVTWLGYPEITVKALPGLHNALKGSVKITNVFGTLLIEVKHELMPFWQQALKQLIDFVFSLTAIIVLSPLFLVCTIGIKLTSKGPVYFRQERIGKNGRAFHLYKFRSMFMDAEKDGPNLSHQNDTRMTPFGRFMRRTKIDEIPNFINVLKGDMSLVGPRPERQYYIDQIVEVSPHYLQLQKIKPGITSLGQVKFGYASNVEEMTKRLRYDILYMENMSVYTDFLIMYYTLVLLFKGRHV